MSIELRLKELIQSRYKSVREFAAAIDMPYSTVDTIFKRGLDKASVSNIIKICQHLSISVDELAEGRITDAKSNLQALPSRAQRIGKMCDELNDEGQAKAEGYVQDLIDSGKYKKGMPDANNDEKSQAG